MFRYTCMHVFLLSHVSALCLLVYQHALGSTVYYAEYMQSQCGQVVSITHWLKIGRKPGDGCKSVYPSSVCKSYWECGTNVPHPMDDGSLLSVFATRTEIRVLHPCLQIVDSIMALFRVDFSGRGELADRQQKLAQLLSRLQKISEGR